MTSLIFGLWSPAWLAWARSCRAAGFDVHLLNIGSDGARRSRYSSCLSSSLPFDRELIFRPEGIDAIRRQVEALGADCLTANRIEHIEWLAANRGVFEPDCKLIASPYEALVALQSKRSQLDIAASAGFRILPTWLVVNADEVDRIPPESYPVAVRPAEFDQVIPKFKVKSFETPDELARFVGGLGVIGSPLIAQPFMPSPNMLVHGVRSPDGSFVEFAGFRVARKFRDFALTVERCDLPSEVETACRRFVDSCGIAGPFHFDLLWPEGDSPYFLEINPRLGGTSGRVAALGFHEARLSLAAFGLTDYPPASMAFASRRRAVEKTAVVRHAWHTIQGRIRPSDYPPASTIGHLTQDAISLLRDRDSIFDWRDLRGSAWYGSGRAMRITRAWLRRKFDPRSSGSGTELTPEPKLDTTAGVSPVDNAAVRPMES